MDLLREPHRDSKVDPPRCEISIGGPRFWLGLAAAFGAALCSVPVSEWFVSFGLPGFVPEKNSGYVFFLTFASLLVAAVWFAGSWYVVGRIYGKNGEIRESALAFKAVFLASASVVIFSLAIAFLPLRDEVFPASIEITGFVVCWVCAYVLPAGLLATKQPRQGLFFGAVAATAFMEFFDFIDPDGFGHATWLTGIRMAIAFICVYGSERSQRIINALIPVALAALSALLWIPEYSDALFGIAVISLAALFIPYFGSAIGTGMGATLRSDKNRDKKKKVGTDNNPGA